MKTRKRRDMKILYINKELAGKDIIQNQFQHETCLSLSIIN